MKKWYIRRENFWGPPEWEPLKQTGKIKTIVMGKETVRYVQHKAKWPFKTEWVNTNDLALLDRQGTKIEEGLI